MSKASLIPESSELIKEVNKELYSFIWKGKDKFKRSPLINDIEDGGLKMLDLESMISAQRVMCIKKYVENYQWKSLEVCFGFLSQESGWEIFVSMQLWSSNTIHYSSYLLQRVQAWSSMTNYDSSSYKGIMNQIIWNNKYILREGKSIF